MAPVVRAIERASNVVSRVCVTAQHRQMLDQVLSLFGIAPDYDLDIMRPGQSLNDLSSRLFGTLGKVFDDFVPNLVLVHGDTTTTFSAAMAAFHHQIPIGHVEAGLRSGDIYSPWPEEANRSLTSRISTLHFAPTEGAKSNLLTEGVSPERIEVTGNTVIDALLETKELLDDRRDLAAECDARFRFLGDKSRLVLITGHRRENFGQGLARICEALRRLATRFPDHAFVYPVHLNPRVAGPVRRHLGGISNIHLIEPLDYLPFVYLMQRAHLIMTDSGGIQEEAPSLGKPVLVFRDTTERPEAVIAGCVRLVGTEIMQIVSTASLLLENDAAWQNMSSGTNPYGDGRAARRIVDRILRWVRSGE